MYEDKVTYENFDGETITEKLFFNLNKVELAENMGISKRFEKLQEQIDNDGKPRQLTTEEIQEMVDLVKELMRISYGVRSEDGRRFIKSDQIWLEFTQTAAYDDYLFGLFEEPSRSINFLTGIMPKDVRAEAEKMMEKMTNGEEVPTSRNIFEQTAEAREASQAAVAPDEKDAGSYSIDQLLEMSDEEFEKLAGSDPQKMSQMGSHVLVAAFQRKNRSSADSKKI